MGAPGGREPSGWGHRTHLPRAVRAFYFLNLVHPWGGDGSRKNVGKDPGNSVGTSWGKQGGSGLGVHVQKPDLRSSLDLQPASWGTPGRRGSSLNTGADGQEQNLISKTL